LAQVVQQLQYQALHQLMREEILVQLQYFQLFHQQVVAVVVEEIVDLIKMVFQEDLEVVLVKEHLVLLDQGDQETLLQLILHKEMMEVLVVLIALIQ
tara:strand:+ start:174 stop:464 length:291 start_codon:yes stop_codon:yes gene_type:complete